LKTFFNTLSTKLFIVAIAAFFLTSCLSDSVTEPEPPPNNEPDRPTATEAVPADGILEAVTWNIEWYGSTGNGPVNELQQTKNVLRIADSLKADLYALQEISNQQSLDSLTEYMTGYRGFVADYSTPNSNQRTAFVYNTETIEMVSSGEITQGQDRNDWASGRFPLFFEFNYNYRGTSTPIYAITIHAKANTGSSNQEREEAYNRRVRAAESLYNFLKIEKPDAHIILLGDFNDDVDVSIFNGSSPSPYEDFVNDEMNFRAITKSISENGQSSYIAGNFSDLIDHIIMSDELFSNYSASSEEIFFDAEDFIENYETSTSDHLPVWTKFDFSSSN
jgi:endonuclease/exonuclease/phosphatase family metal-dependent hydrolase